MDDSQTEWLNDGVTCIRGLLDARGRALAELAFNWSLANPGPGAGEVLAGAEGAFYQDHAHPAAFEAYRPLICDTGLARRVAQLMGSKNLWLLYEQIWLKEGAAARATPWHQDLPYLPLGGTHVVTVWLNLDPLPREASLEFIRGSHRGPLYNPTAFDARDPRAAMYAEGVWPQLPDIEADRTAWEIVSWRIEPGDAVIFHPAVLHGGAATRAGGRRRSISLRFIGDEAYVAERPEEGPPVSPEAVELDPMQELSRRPPGTPFRHAAFPQVY